LINTGELYAIQTRKDETDKAGVSSISADEDQAIENE
jgi:hypothetical protein